MQTIHEGSAGTVTRWWLELRRFAARHVLLVDVAIAAVPGGAIVWGTIGEATERTPAEPLDWGGVLLVVVAALSLALRRRAPLVAFALAYGATLTYLLTGNPFGPVVQLAGLAMYAVGAWTPPKTSAAVCLAAVAAYLPFEVAFRWAPTPLPATLLITAGWLVLPWLLGAAMRAYRGAKAEIAAADRRKYAYEERLQIAREVHDVVGHSLAVISMQAGAALHTLDRRPRPDIADISASLRAIRMTSNEALGELRTTLTAFPEPDHGNERVGLHRLPALIDAITSPALDVALTVEGERGSVPAPVDLTGYRIVQEALTNVVRHADAGQVRVHIGYGRDAVRIAVTDDGRAAGVPAPPGRGLAGMRERARAVGGTLRCGPRPDGCGFEVAAELPRVEAGG